jgi:hypothetical protein
MAFTHVAVKMIHLFETLATKLADLLVFFG